MIKNKLYKAISFVCLLVFFTATACETCYDCGPQNAYPYFKFTVLNETSLDTLVVDVTRLKAEIKSINEQLAANGGQSASLNSQLTIKTDSLAYYNDLVATVKNRIVSIALINNRDDVFTFEEGETDSLKVFGIPINTDDTISNYIIKIEGASFENELSLSYQLIDTVINDKVTKAAKKLKVIYHDFKAIRGPYGCTETFCISNKQTIYVEI